VGRPIRQAHVKVAAARQVEEEIAMALTTLPHTSCNPAKN